LVKIVILCVFCLDQPILSFGLEPYGTKFAVLHGEPPGRISFSCYELSHKGAGSSVSKISECVWVWVCGTDFTILLVLMLLFSELSLLLCAETMERKQTNQVFWCPKGKFLVLAGLKG